MIRRAAHALCLLAIGCASNGPELEFGLSIPLPAAEAQTPPPEPEPGPPTPPAAPPAVPEATPAPPAAPAPAPDELESAIRDYDAAALLRFVDAEYARLESEKEAGVDEARRFARACLHLAEIRKFEATVASSDEARESAIEARLSIARRGAAVASAALGAAGDDAELLFYHGELLAYLIDGALSGMRYGKKAQETTERAVALGAGPEAELALAKRWYYLPRVSGGDTGKAIAAVEAILESHPRCEPAWGFLAEVHQARGERAAAEAASRRAVELNPKSLRGRFLLDHPGAKPRP